MVLIHFKHQIIPDPRPPMNPHRLGLSQASHLSHIPGWDSFHRGNILLVPLPGNDPVHRGFAPVHQVRDFPHRFSLPLTRQNVGTHLAFILLALVPQMFRFLPVALVQEPHVSVLIGDLVYDDIVRVVQILTGPDLDLLDKLDPLVLRRLSDGKHVVKEIVQLLGSGKVVLCDRIAQIPCGLDRQAIQGRPQYGGVFLFIVIILLYANDFYSQVIALLQNCFHTHFTYSARYSRLKCKYYQNQNQTDRNQSDIDQPQELVLLDWFLRLYLYNY